MAFKLPDLPYDHKALEPHFDGKTMKIHHGKHHAGYTSKLNGAIEGTELEKLSIEELLKKHADSNTGVRNNGGGYYNHSLFWKILSPDGGDASFSKTNKFGKDFLKTFGTLEKFKEDFSKAAATRFGSGWAWLCLNKRKKLKICSTPNQDNPLMNVESNGCAGKPILGLDVWEHAYYLKYQNKRPDYIEAFFSIVDWKQVGKNYNAAVK